MRKENQIRQKEPNLLLLYFFSLKINKGLVKISLPMLTTIIYFAMFWGKVKSRNWMSTVRNQLFYDLPTPSPIISPKMALSLKPFPWNKSPQFSILHKAVQNCSFSSHGRNWCLRQSTQFHCVWDQICDMLDNLGWDIMQSLKHH